QIGRGGQSLLSHHRPHGRGPRGVHHGGAGRRGTLPPRGQRGLLTTPAERERARVGPCPSSGASGTRTRNPLLAKQVRYQLRHGPRSDPGPESETVRAPAQRAGVSAAGSGKVFPPKLSVTSAQSSRSSRSALTLAQTAYPAAASTASPRNFFMVPLLGVVVGVGLTGLEPVTSSLSGKRSNRLSYRPGAPRLFPRVPKQTTPARGPFPNPRREIGRAHV